MKKYATERLQADYFLARINVQNVPSIHLFLRQESAFIGRTETGNFPNGSKVSGLNVFFPSKPETMKDKCVFLKSTSISKIVFPIEEEKEYARFCKLIEFGHVMCFKNDTIEICKPYIRTKEMEEPKCRS